MAAEFGLGTPPGLCKLKYMGENRLSPIYFNFNGVHFGPKCSPTPFGDGGTFIAAEFGLGTPPDVYKLKYMGENRISPIYITFNVVPFGRKCSSTPFGYGGTFLAAEFTCGTPPGQHKLQYMGKNPFLYMMDGYTQIDI